MHLHRTALFFGAGVSWGVLFMVAIAATLFCYLLLYTCTCYRAGDDDGRRAAELDDGGERLGDA